MERRLGRLETLWQASSQAVQEASWDIQWAVQYPHLENPEVRAAAIRKTHGLDDIGITRAISAALVRCGIPRGEAVMLAQLELEDLLSIAANDEREMA